MLWLSTFNTSAKIQASQNNFCPNKCKLQKLMLTTMLRFPLCSKGTWDGDNLCGVSFCIIYCAHTGKLFFLWNEQTYYNYFIMSLAQKSIDQPIGCGVFLMHTN